MTATVSILRPRPDDLVRTALALGPALRVWAEQADRECKIPDETVAEMHRAGLFRVLQPERHGGYEMDPAVFFDVQMALARNCMSTAWIYGVSGVGHPILTLITIIPANANGSIGKRARESGFGIRETCHNVKGE